MSVISFIKTHHILIVVLTIVICAVILIVKLFSSTPAPSDDYKDLLKAKDEITNIYKQQIKEDSIYIEQLQESNRYHESMDSVWADLINQNMVNHTAIDKKIVNSKKAYNEIPKTIDSIRTSNSIRRAFATFPRE